MAIIKVLKFMCEHNLENVNICSDSLSLLKALKSGRKGKHKLCPIVEDIRFNIFKLKHFNSNCNIRFTWCPAHIGIAGNERADREAKLAATSGLVVNNKVDFNQLISSFKDYYISCDNEILNYLNKNAGKSYFDNFASFNLKFFRKLSLVNCKTSIIIRLISGYAYTGHYLFRISVRDSPACECGYEDQNVNHLFLQCKLLDAYRVILLKELIKIKIFPPYSMNYLLGILNEKIVGILLRSIHSTEMNL